MTNITSDTMELKSCIWKWMVYIVCLCAWFYFVSSNCYCLPCFLESPHYFLVWLVPPSSSLLSPLSLGDAGPENKVNKVQPGHLVYIKNKPVHLNVMFILLINITKYMCPCETVYHNALKWNNNLLNGYQWCFWLKNVYSLILNDRQCDSNSQSLNTWVSQPVS